MVEADRQPQRSLAAGRSGEFTALKTIRHVMDQLGEEVPLGNSLAATYFAERRRALRSELLSLPHSLVNDSKTSGDS